MHHFDVNGRFQTPVFLPNQVRTCETTKMSWAKSSALRPDCAPLLNQCHHPAPNFESVEQSVADHSINFVTRRTETSELDLFAILDLLRITVAPFDWHIGVGICVY